MSLTTLPFDAGGSTNLTGLSSVNNNSQTTIVDQSGAAADLNPQVLPNQEASTSSSSNVSSSSSPDDIESSTTPPITNAGAASVAAATAPAGKEEALQSIKDHADAQIGNILKSETGEVKYEEVEIENKYELERINVESRMTPEQFTTKPQAAENAESKTSTGDASQPEKKSTNLYRASFKEFYDVAIGVRKNPEQYEKGELEKAKKSTDEERKYTSIRYGNLPHVQRHLENGIKATNNEIHQVEKKAADDALAKFTLGTKGQSKRDVLSAFNELPPSNQNKLRELAKLSVLTADERAILNDPDAKVSPAKKKELEAKVEGRLLRLFGAKESTMEKMERVGSEVLKKLNLFNAGLFCAALLPVFAVFSGIGILLESIDASDYLTKDEYYGKVLEPTATINAYHVAREFFDEVFSKPIRPEFAPYEDFK